MKLEEAIAKAKILNDSLKELTDEYEGQGSFIAAGMAVSFKLVLDTHYPHRPPPRQPGAGGEGVSGVSLLQARF